MSLCLPMASPPASSGSADIAAKTAAVVAPRASTENRVTSTIARFVSALRSLPGRLLSGARALRDPDVLRDLAPLVLPLALAPWLWIALPHYATAELWNDVTAMNYAGWCVRHGVRMYDGVALP